jgi:hypothetical protein
MDLYCPVCAEPIDNDEFHDVAAEIGSTYSAVAADFRERGCKALPGSSTHCVPVQNDRTAAATAMYELLGDDMDGAAAMFEDLGL